MCKPDAPPPRSILDCDKDPTKIPEVRAKLIEKCDLPIEATDAQVQSCVRLQGEYLNELRRQPLIGRCAANPSQSSWDRFWESVFNRK